MNINRTKIFQFHNQSNIGRKIKMKFNFDVVTKTEHGTENKIIEWNEIFRPSTT